MRREHGKLTAGADIHEHFGGFVAHRAQKAGLIVTDGGTDSRILEVPDYRLGGKLRDKVRVDTGFLQSGLVESTVFRVEEADACGIAVIHARRSQSAQPHGKVVTDGAAGDGGGRYKSGGKVVRVRCQTETDCGKASGLAREILHPAFGFAVRQAAACVLPGVQRTDGIAVRVHIQDAVHLPGHANGMNIRIAFKQRFDNKKCDLRDLFHVLLACARQRRRNKGTVCPRFAGEKLPVLEHSRADRCGADVNA